MLQGRTFSNLKENQDIVYIFKNNKIEPVIITKGLSDMNFIEITDGLKRGDKVITQFIGGDKR